ncbi:unnamed protein product, partial [Darwinula stevensoni]
RKLLFCVSGIKRKGRRWVCRLFPRFTSSNCVAGNVSVGLGIGSDRIHYVLGLVKAYTTRVGSGPFPSELYDANNPAKQDPIGMILADRGQEFGSVTGRPRRTGWMDVALLRRAVQMNGLSGLCITKLDVLDTLAEIKLCVGYMLDGKEIDLFPHGAHEAARCEPIYETWPGWQSETFGIHQWDQLPLAAQQYLKRIELLAGVPISIVSTGPERNQTILLQHPFKGVCMKIAIIGSGFSGLGMAYYLDKAGFTDYTIYEKANDVGGCWRENTYPGVACDVPSMLYSFSFELYPEWKHVYSRGEQIWEYLRFCAQKYGWMKKIQFGVEFNGGEFDEKTHQWRLSTTTGRVIEADFVVVGAGPLHVPSYPNIPGLDTFKGAKIHSAKWDHDINFKDKRVAVIGTGASAIQFVPELAKEVKDMTVFQRSPTWIVPRYDRPYTDDERASFRKSPLRMKLTRLSIFLINEFNGLGIYAGNPVVSWLTKRMAKHNIHKAISDPELRQKVTPDYPPGCKRILISNDWYPALAKPNVHLETEPIAKVVEDGVVTESGKKIPADVLVYGTGFKVTDGLPPFPIYGVGHENVVDRFASEGIAGYQSTFISGFPNCAILLGPNAGLGHNSVVYMAEAQMRYIVKALKYMRKHHYHVMDVKRHVQDEQTKELHEALKDSVWVAGGCQSWYLEKSGETGVLWPHSAKAFDRSMQHFDADAYRYA